MGRRRLSGGTQVIERAFLAVILILLSVAPAVSIPADAGTEKVLLVHVTALLDKDTERTALVFRVIAGGLKKGHRVVLFFDANGVSSLKMGRWFGGHSTPLDRTLIADKDRKELAALLGTSVEGVPDIYGSLLHFLKGRGVAIYASRRALELHGIGADHFDHAAEPADEEKVLELLGQAGAYVSY
jgi:hypothetical protein